MLIFTVIALYDYTKQVLKNIKIKIHFFFNLKKFNIERLLF